MDVNSGNLLVIDAATDRLYAFDMNRGPQG